MDSSMKKLSIILIAMYCLLSNSLVAQDGYDWGSNKPEAQGDWVHMNNLIKEDMFVEAKKPTAWLLHNAPNLNLDLYVQAIKVYEGVEETINDDATKIGIQDTVLKLYDLRISKFGDDEASVLNRKGLNAYSYLAPRKGTTQELFDLYKKILDLNGTSTYSTNLLSYMKVTCLMKREDKLTDDQVLDIYDNLNEVLDQQVAAKPSKASTVEKVKAAQDKILFSCISMDCDMAQTKLGPKLKEDPTNLKMAKRIVSIMRANACVSNELYLEAADVILAQEPTVSAYKEKGNVLANLKKYSEAIEDYKKAAEMASAEEDKETEADLYIKIAKLYSTTGQKNSARTYARKSIATGFNSSEAHTLIGDLYMYSSDECKSDDVLQYRSIYIAAYEEYKKAGNSSKMESAHQNFPSMEEIFVRNKKVGESISTGCWIGETVTLQKR